MSACAWASANTGSCGHRNRLSSSEAHHIQQACVNNYDLRVICITLEERVLCRNVIIMDATVPAITFRQQLLQSSPSSYEILEVTDISTKYLQELSSATECRAQKAALESDNTADICTIVHMFESLKKL